MNKSILVLTVVFGLSLGLSTGVTMATHPLEEHEDSVTELDSLSLTDIDTSSVAIESEELDSMAEVNAALVSSQDSTLHTQLPLRPAPQRKADTGMVARLANVFSAMNPQDAARVLNAMSDSDLRLILMALPRKQQAAILSNLTTDRAAIITSSALRDNE